MQYTRFVLTEFYFRLLWKAYLYWQFDTLSSEIIILLNVRKLFERWFRSENIQESQSDHWQTVAEAAYVKLQARAQIYLKFGTLKMISQTKIRVFLLYKLDRTMNHVINTNVTIAWSTKGGRRQKSIFFHRFKINSRYNSNCSSRVDFKWSSTLRLRCLLVKPSQHSQCLVI